MDSRINDTKMTKRKIVGLLSLIVFSLAFIFSCLKKVLPVGAWLVGTFGSLIYPMSVVFAFISLAMFLGFSYSRNKKPIVLFSLTLFSVILAIHSISTYKSLNNVVNFSYMKDYLNFSYQKTTLVGSFGSVLAAMISILLGGMGTIVSCVIVATISAGLLLDYEIYGKYQEPQVKKLKTRKMREKVNNSDKNLNQDGSLNYSFSENNNLVADEISVDAREYEESSLNHSNLISNYASSEVVDEITSDESSFNFNTDSSFAYDSSSSDENQTLNTFTSNIYKTDNIPDVYSSEVNDFRRQFMNDTFGTTAGTASENFEFAEASDSNFNFSESVAPSTNFSELPDFKGFEEEENNTSESEPFSYNSFENEEESEPAVDETFSKFLNSNEEEIETEIKNDVLDNFTGLGFEEKQEFNPFAEERKPLFEQSQQIQSNPFTNNRQSQNFERFGAGFNPNQNFNQNQYNSNFGRNDIPLNNPNMGFASRPFEKPNIPVQKREVKQTPYVSKIGMAGIRYNAPTLSLLKTPIPDTGDYTAEQNRKTMILENSLEAFKVPAKVKNIVRGPKITRYELSVPLGISVKKIPMYENDIAAALAAKTITIKAPIPGSTFVGIELENDTFTTVYQRELFESDAFQNCKDPLPIAIGKDISGEIIVKSLADMVHLLIAGSTGSGKSVFIHNVVLSLIFKSSPDDLRLIMIDPKKVEFPIYNGLPHLLTPEVVAGSQKAINALKWCVREMDRRYDLMAKAGHRDIKSFNKSELVKAGQFEKLPYIVIIVDELAEIMQANKKEAEACIQRITQLARACGMHMVLATQRPSVDIITGVIKNNIPSRIAFSLQSGIDSKTIINTIGAEKLLGKGDMIFAPTGTSAMPRLQASYASDDEIKAVIDYTIRNNEANYDEAVEKAMEQEQVDSDSAGSFNGGDGVPPQKDALDSYFKAAVKIVMQNGGASTSYLQRRFSIGYSRAAKIMDQMAAKGYIGEASGSKQRKILITPEQFREEFGEDFDSVD